MRKFSMSMMLCIIMVSSAFLASCSKDETNDSSSPITELTFPASDADNPIYTGDLVQIGGKGFAADCEIWLQGADGKEVEAAITVSSDGVSFIAPSISGKYSVELEQGGEAYALGELFFAEREGESHLFVWGDKNENSSFYEYDTNKGTFSPFSTIKGSVWKSVLPGKGGLVYYFKDLGLYCYDLKTENEIQICGTNWLAKMEKGGTGQAIGMINGKLHGVKYSQKDGFVFVAIAGDGKETVIKTFQAFSSPDGKGAADFFCEDDNLLFAYDEVNQIVFLTGGVNTELEYYEALVALNLKTEKVETLMDKKINWYQCLNVNGKIWLFADMDKEETQVASQINPLTLRTEQTINELSGNYAYRPVYSKIENVVYWTGFTGTTEDMRAVTSYNVQTKKVAAVSKISFDVEGVFVATY